MQIFDLFIDKTNWIEIQSISIIFDQWGISAFHWVIKFPFDDRRLKGIKFDEDLVLKVHVF